MSELNLGRKGTGGSSKLCSSQGREVPLSPTRRTVQVHGRSVETVRGYLRDAELFQDHAATELPHHHPQSQYLIL